MRFFCFSRGLCFVLLGLLNCCAVTRAVSDTALAAAFSDVFEVRDVITDARAPVMEAAFRQLDQLGVPRDLQTLGNLTDDAAGRVLMRAALGNLMLGLRESGDWSVVAADVGSGKLVRRRSFSSVRFAVIESLLLVAILALGRAVWIKPA